MSLLLSLASFGLRQVIFEPAEKVAEFLVERFRDQSQTLPKALATANDRAWQVLALSLGGDGLFEKIKLRFAAGEERVLAQQLRAFLDRPAGQFRETNA